MTRRMKTAAAILLAVVAAGRAAAAPSLRVSANRDSIYIGESFILSVLVEGSRIEEPDLSSLAGGAVRLLGSQERSNYSISFVKGRLTRTGFSGREFTYEVTPAASGDFRAGPVTATVDGARLSDPGPLVRVQGMEEQDTVRIRVSSTRNAVLVDEPFEITVGIAIRRLDGRFAELDPLHPSDPPHLSIPFLSSPPGPGVDVPDVRPILQGMLANRPNQPAFTINDFTVSNDPMGGFFGLRLMSDSQPARFTLPRKAVELDGREYWEYSIALKYTPREEATHTFGPVVFKGSAVASVNPAGQPALERIMAVGPACTVRIVPPPEKGRPASYVGAVGSNMTADAVLDTQTCKVGDPLTLTVRIGGPVSTRQVRAPVLSEQQDIARLFRVYDETVKVLADNGGRKFVYTIRPMTHGTYELPPIELAYYDVNLNKYASARTAPVPLRVNKAAEFDGAAVIASSTNAVSLRLHESAPALPPAPLAVGQDGISSVSFFDPRVHIPIAVFGPAIFALAIAWSHARRLLVRISAAAAGNSAARRAAAEIRAASEMPPGASKEAAALAAAALKTVLAARLGRASASLTPAEAVPALVSGGASPAGAAACARIMDRLSAASCGGAPLDAESWAELVKLLPELDSQLRKGGR